MKQLEKIERNRKLPLRPQEVESMCSNMDGFQRDATISSYYPKKNKVVTLLSTMHYDKGTESFRANKHIKFSLYIILRKELAFYKSDDRRPYMVPTE